ncbi:MCM2/3/5 family-domain-containing protein [Lobosporangium transversale]|uniref:DNA helicase n=1 Tax=Lobosporangium transversale TaxID=64571 RepID=A0A1Y2H243_9FUNG|nr:MCM2/3/5 family-domain-containing protein [Lobosporangium transversale]ORZ28616.1 MCM2/3/5 family-domain-containing protein [Lobosporangium transversale]|eukprot:XP_021886289.1 MCM2/3/5 family-domain-containing protein [Lobosporangium transversale]
MPPEQSNPRGAYARQGGGGRGGWGYFRGRGRGKRHGGDGSWFNENGSGRNNLYPGRSQNPDANEQNGNKRWQRPRTSAPKNQNQDQDEDGIVPDVNTIMVQANEIPAAALQIQRTAPPMSKHVVSCPWKDWDVYFPQEVYHSQHEFLPWIAEFKRYIQDYHLYRLNKEHQCAIAQRRVLVVNLKNLVQACKIEDLMKLIVERPTDIIGCITLAAIQAIFGEEATKTTQQKRFTVRFACFDKITRGKDLKADLIGKMVCVRGTVVRTSGVKPLAIKMAFTCNTCQAVQTVEFKDARYEEPTRCLQVGCRSGKFTPQRGIDYETETVDWQVIRLQEKLPDDRLDSGRVPRSIECEVINDLVDRVIPGDVVEITGIVKVAQTEKAYHSRTRTGNTMYLLYIDVNYLQKSSMTTVDEEENDQDYDPKGSSKDSKDSIQINTRDLYAIEDITREPQLFKLIVNSFCPLIFGHEMVKAGILFALFGGRRRGNSAIDRTVTRADPHVLVVGDPGLGKSQMLSAAVKVAPRGVYVCGSSGVSTGGLTVTLVRGSGSDFALEAGALVLGDQGCCCIDEFDKMTTDHNALLEAMEQQSISIAKAGVLCTLPARTSVIAAANPKGGHYNTAKSVAENLKMNGALLSRFDLIFILMDKPDSEMDKYLSRHVMALHAGHAADKRALRPTSSQDSEMDRSHPSESSDTKARMSDPLSERLKMTKEDDLQLIAQPLLRKYIAYARQYVHPRLSPEAAAILQDYYLALRERHRSPDGTPVTTRQLESLIRMAEAKARIELRELVTKRDAMDVVEIMTFSLRDAFGSGQGLGPSQGQGSSGRGKGAAIKRYVAQLQKIANETSSSMFSYEQLYRTFQDMQFSDITGGFQGFIETLNNQNFLLKKGSRTYQLTMVM